jgi:lysophospholipase L1-like esterase
MACASRGTAFVRTRLLAAVLLFTTTAVGAWPRQSNAVTGDRSHHWVGTWASAPQPGDEGNAPPAPGFADCTIRQIVHASIGGKLIRVRFSNAFGNAPLTIPSAHVALAAGGSAIKPASDRALTFHGVSSFAIPPGALIYSDPLPFELAPLSDLAVTIYLAGVPQRITAHPGARGTSYLQAGDFVSVAEMPTATRVDHWYFVNGVDVLAKNSVAAVVALGDSITDGRGSITNGNGRWPDYLARRLQADKRTRNVAVLNEGIGGNRLLHDGLGQNVLARLDRDVLAQSGVRWLIVLVGINDLGARKAAGERNEEPASPAEIIAAYEQIILRAHAHNIRVYGATILACQGSNYFSTDLEADRQAINSWIRTSGNFDAVIDLDAATRDPGQPARLSEAADSGDHLHPGDKGYRAMADAINLQFFDR